MNTRIPSGGILPAGGVAPRPVMSRTQAHARPGAANFDQIRISRQPQGQERRVQELVGRISQQVRTRHTLGEIGALQRQVAEGTYQPDASEIAARMLLVREDL